MAKKSFKNEVQQPRPAAATFISNPEGEGDERKTKRFNLLLRPSLYTKLSKIATMNRQSVNDLINQAMNEYSDSHRELIERYDQTFSDD